MTRYRTCYRMSPAWDRSPAFSVVPLALFLAVAGNGACGASATKAPPQVSSTTPPDYGPDVAVATVCRDPSTGAETGRYIFSDMNAILERCPGIGATLPFQRVETCEQAQAFSDAYQTYGLDHSTSECETTPEYNIVDYVEERPSALIGDPVTNSNFPNSPNPTVGLVRTVYKGGKEYELGSCSGVFFAKNYIFTAKHCLDASMPTLRGFDRWKVRWATSNAAEKYRYEKTFYALQLPNPDPDVDLALIYLQTWDGYDRFLPPNISAYGAYLAENATPEINKGTQFFVAGWGAPTLALQTSTVSMVYESGTESYGVVASAGHHICHGDSGGPLYWMSSDPNPVVAGLDRRGQDPTPDGCGQTTDVHFYTRVDTDDVRTWLDSEMASNDGENVPNHGIKEKSGNTWCWPTLQDSAGEPLDAYRCWGDPCGGNAATPCAGGMESICVGDGDDYATATCDQRICGGGCGCLVGECIYMPGDPLPTSPDAGALP